MQHPTLAIIFRNPCPRRSPVHTELYLFRADGSSTRIDYTDQGDFHQPKEFTKPAPRGIR